MWKYFLLNLLTRVVCTSFMRWSGTTLWSDIAFWFMHFGNFLTVAQISLQGTQIKKFWATFSWASTDIEKSDKIEQIWESLTKLVQKVCKNIERNSNQSEPTETPEYIELKKIINNFLFSPSIFLEPLTLLTLRATKNFHAAFVRLSCARKQLFYLAHVEISWNCITHAF